LTGGDIFGTVPENPLVNHRLMVPPKISGKISYIAPQGNYNLSVILKTRSIKTNIFK
jgi:V-type H+-transporting ATPase subunit A